MPVKKYRSVADMPGPPPLPPLRPDNLRVACDLSEMARALYPRKLEPGLRKFRSAREAQEYRERQDRPGKRRDAS